jgi:hypothetical protein
LDPHPETPETFFFIRLGIFLVLIDETRPFLNPSEVSCWWKWVFSPQPLIGWVFVFILSHDFSGRMMRSLVFGDLSVWVGHYCEKNRVAATVS